MMPWMDSFEKTVRSCGKKAEQEPDILQRDSTTKTLPNLAHNAEVMAM